MDYDPPPSPRAKIVYALWKNLPRFIVLALVILIVFLFVIMGEEKKRLDQEKSATAAPEQPPINVVVLPLSPVPIRNRINLPGEIEPWLDLDLLAKINGTVTEVLLEAGEHVEKGMLLARIEDDDYRIALAMAEAAHKLAKSEYQRDLSISQKGIISSAELEAKKTRLETTKSEMDNGKLQLSRCEIRSPISGVINKMFAKTGLLLSVADPVAEILQINKVKAVVGIPESDVARVSELSEIDLTIKALNNMKVKGTKHFLASSPESTARLYRLELTVDNPNKNILPGMFIRADIVKERIPDAMVVPLYSVISQNDLHFVYVEKDGIARKKEVTLGFLEGWKVLIQSGLRPGDRVLIEGQRAVEDGQTIKVIRVLDNLDTILP